jgi:Tol biopolymer transport system component
LLALAVTEAAGGRSDIYILDLGRGTRARLTTAGGGDASPVWAPDARRLVFRSVRELVHDLFVKDVLGTASEQPFYRSGVAKYPTSWSRDGQALAFHTRSDVTRWDVAIAPTTGAGTPRLLLHSPSNERQAQFSPDGRWVAYTGDESRQDEVYIQSMHAGPPRLQVSVNGGEDPHWRADGRELFYISPDGDLVAVALRYTSNAITAGPPRRLFRIRGGRAGPPYLSRYDVSVDGRRFLVRMDKEDTRSLPLTVLVNPSLGAGR